MKTLQVRSKAEKLNWKPLKEVVPVNISADTLKGKRVVVTGHQKKTAFSKIVIP